MDSFRNLKYVGYCMSNLPPEDVGRTTDDFINYCKFQLCVANHRLMKDPIWDNYEDEEIIAEYYAHVMTKDEEYTKQFLQELNGVNPDVYDWLDEMIEKNAQELESLAKDTDDKIEFDPTSLGE